MAENLGAAELRVEVNTEQIEGALRALRQTVERFNPEFRGLQQNLRNITTQIDRARTEALSFNQVLNQAPGASYARISAQIIRLTRESRNLRATSQEYLNVLQRISELEFVRGARAGRQRVAADFEAVRGATLRRGYGAQDRLPDLPQTLAADQQRLRELNFILNNTDKSAAEFGETLNQIAVIERRVSDALNNTSEAFRRQEQAAAGAERRLAKLQQIQQYYSELNPRAGGFRDPATGAIIARGAGSANDERAYRAALGASRELLEVDLQRIQAVRRRTQALKEATAANRASQESGFAAFSQALSDPVRRAIERNRQRQEQRQGVVRIEPSIGDIRQQDIFAADLARVQKFRRSLGPKPAPPPAATRAPSLLARLSSRGALSSALIGGGFPLLFGQGIGAAGGGLLGGLGGGALGGDFGFGASIVGTLIGTQFDTIIAKSRDLAGALRNPIESFTALQQNAQLSSKGVENYIAALIKVGREAEAGALIQQDLSETYGDLTSARALASAQDSLARSASRLTQAFASLIVPGLADYLRGIADLFENIRGVNTPEGRQRLATTSRGTLTNDLASALPALRKRGVGRRSIDELVAGPQAPTTDRQPQLPPEVVQARRSRAALLTSELRAITAQAQGYRELALQSEIAVVNEKERIDLIGFAVRLRQADSNEQRANIKLEVDARRQQALKERIALEEQLAEVQRRNAVLAETRPAILRQSLALINAQVNGTERQALIEQRRLATLETDRQLREEGNRDPARRGQIREQDAIAQARLTAQLARLDRERGINARFRIPLLQQELSIIGAQTAGEERRALVLQRQRNIAAATRELALERDPQKRLDIQANATAQERRDRAAILEFDKQRAVAVREIAAASQQDQRNAALSLQFARERSGVEAGVARQAVETRQGVLQSITEARTQQEAAVRALREAQAQGGDPGRLRAFEILTRDLPNAAAAIQLALINGATTLRDAGRNLVRDLQSSQTSLLNLRLTNPQFTTPEERRFAISELQQRVRAEEGRRGVIFTARGTEQERIQAQLGFLQFGQQEQQFIEQGRQLSEALAIVNRPLIDSNATLVTTQTILAEAITKLNDKDWAVNVAISPDGRATTTGDVLTSAAGAI